jgi:hypothetical protein
LATLTFYSCNKVEPPVASDTVFFPLKLSTYTVFKVTVLEHDAFTERTDTISYFIKETTQDTIINNAGKLVYRTKIEQSQNDTNYTFIKYVIEERDDLSAQRVEDDTRKIKLSFPLKERKTWDANEFNINDYQSAETIKINEPYMAGDTEFTETVIVDLGNDINPFFTTVEEEVYAKNIGLINRIVKEIETQPGKYKDGTEYEQTFYRTNK